MVVGNCHLQGRQPLPWDRSPVSFGQISLGVVFQEKSWDKGPCSLALPRIVHHQWPVAPDMIWHIYSHLYCSSGDSGRDLLSLGEVAPARGQVPCQFWADQPTFIFQSVAPDMIRHIYCGRGWRYGPAIFRGCCTHQGTCRGPYPDQGAPPLKTASGWHHPPLSSNAQSKCAKSCQEPPAEKWCLADLLETHRGLAPW